MSYTEREMNKLRASMRWSANQLEPFRAFRGKLVKEFAGHEYTSEGADREVMFNAWGLAVEILSLAVSGGTPQVDLYTDREDLLAFAADFSAILNKELLRIDFGDVLEELVVETIFGLGVLKVGTTEGAHYLDVLPGMQMRRSRRLFADVVDLDCWVHDMEATDWDEIDYCGDRYRCSLDAVRENKEYNREARRKVQAKQDSRVNTIPDFERTADLTEDFGYTGEDHFFEYVDLWDIFIPRDNVIVTLVDGQENLPPLLVREWDGPRNYSGPYYILPASKVPGNLMPKTPGHHLLPLHELINRLWRKLSRQAGNQKTIVMVENGSEDDGRKIAEANDTQVIAVSNVQSVVQQSFLGADQGNAAFAMQSYDAFNRLAGNIEAVGGLGPQSSTVGQDSMIASTVGRRIGKLQQRILKKVVQITADIGWYLWISDDELTAKRDIGIAGITVPVRLGPDDREGNWDDYDVSIAPSSLQFASSGERAQAVMNLLSQLIIPSLPFMEAQGVTMDWSRVIQLLAKQNNLPELNNLVRTQAPNPYQSDTGSRGGKPANTKRTYERVSRPAATREGNTQTLMQLAAGGAQQSQVAALGRPTGV